MRDERVRQVVQRGIEAGFLVPHLSEELILRAGKWLETGTRGGII